MGARRALPITSSEASRRTDPEARTVSSLPTEGREEAHGAGGGVSADVHNAPQMPTVESALIALERGKRERPSGGATVRALARFSGALPRDPEAILRLHEALLFHAAYPETGGVRRLALGLLARIPDRLAGLASAGADLSLFDEPENAGIGGTDVRTVFTFDFLRYLVRRHGGAVRIDWDATDAGDRLGAAWPRIVPLLEEEALADANVPYREWLAAARGRSDELPWLLARFEALRIAPRLRAELFDALGLSISWTLSADGSRTLARAPSRAPFLHPRPLLARRDVDLRRLLEAPPLTIARMRPRDAERRLDLARQSGGSRYRELYGFTYGDPATARVADVGRGVEIALFGAPPDRRLPLRAGFAAFVTKNGIPVAYVEGLALFERIEVGFNVYYTLREGESAWIYGQVLKLFREALGVTSYSIDPYQIGFDNEEAVASGAFWFYRKLGFRPTSAALAAEVEAEERRLAEDPARRTPARLLRRFAGRNLLYDAAAATGAGAGAWDRFHVRNVGLAAGRRMAREFSGDAKALRRSSAARVARRLGVSLPLGQARTAFEDLSLVLDLVPDLARWKPEEKALAAAILRAKASRDETRYLRLMQRHGRMREAFLKLGRGD